MIYIMYVQYIHIFCTYGLATLLLVPSFLHINATSLSSIFYITLNESILVCISFEELSFYRAYLT